MSACFSNTIVFLQWPGSGDYFHHLHNKHFDWNYGAALLHDIGHGPLSHTSEEIFELCHEEWTAKLINSCQEITKILNKYGKGNAKAISDLIQSRKMLKYR